MVKAVTFCYKIGFTWLIILKKNIDVGYINTAIEVML